CYRTLLLSSFPTRRSSDLLCTLANLPEHPQSVPINQLVQVEGTPLAGRERPDSFEFVRTIAVARILMPRSYVRLSAGRAEMSERSEEHTSELQSRENIVCR